MSSNRSDWVVRAERISKTFGTTPALVGIDLAVSPGETVAIMGPSGSGKSTLLHLLAGIEVPDTGRVLLRSEGHREGEDLGLLSDDARSALRLHRFGFVFQQGLLIPELTAVENVALPLLLTGRGRRDAITLAEAALARLGLGGLGQRRIGQLSGGQAQRVAVARSTIMEPQVIFADEPTGALDSHTAHAVLTQLLEIGTEASRAVVIVTHDHQVATRCSRVIRLLDGHVDSIEQGAIGR